MSKQKTKKGDRTKLGRPKGRHIVLTTGKKIVLAIDYGEKEVPRRKSVTGRLTRVVCKLEDGSVLKGESVCAPEDQFNYYLGKKIALRKMFDADPDHVLLTIQDRHDICEFCMPKLFRQPGKTEPVKFEGWRTEKHTLKK